MPMLIFTSAVFISCSVLLWVLFAIEKRRIRRLQMEAQRQELERLNRLDDPDCNNNVESNSQSGTEPSATTTQPLPSSGSDAAHTQPADQPIPQKMIHTTPY
jgi:hypothetical protein